MHKKLEDIYPFVQFAFLIWSINKLTYYYLIWVLFLSYDIYQMEGPLLHVSKSKFYGPSPGLQSEFSSMISGA